MRCAAAADLKVGTTFVALIDVSSPRYAVRKEFEFSETKKAW